MKMLWIVVLLSASLMYAQTPAAAPTSAPAQAAPAQAAPAQAAPRTAAPAPTVQKLMLMFSATDASGNPVANISKSQLSIMDNGHLATVSELHAMPDLPIDMGIILLGRVDFGQQQAAAIELAKILRPGKDRAFVMVAGGAKAINAEMPWISDQSALINQIKNLDKHNGYPDPFEYNMNRTAAGLERQVVQEYSSDTASFFDFAWKNFQASPRFARRVIVVFRTPMGHGPGMAGRSVEAAALRQMHVVQGSQFFRSPIFVVGIEDLGTYMSGPKDIGQISMSVNGGSGDAADMRSKDRMLQRVVEQQYEAGRTSLNEIAANSGGRSWWGSHKNYAEAVSGIIAELAVPYVVAFDATAPAEVHNIKVSAGNGIRVSVQQTIYHQMPSSTPPDAQAASKAP